MRRSRALALAGAATGVLLGVGAVLLVVPGAAPAGSGPPPSGTTAAGSRADRDHGAGVPQAPGATASPAPASALAALSPSAPQPSPGVLSAVLGPLLAAPGLGPSVGATVLDAATGRVLLDRGGSTPRRPASTAKLLTAVAALHRLGPEATARTTAVAGSSPDEVVLVGGGDLLLGPGAGGAPGTVVGRAGRGDLAAQVAAARSAAGASGPVRLVLDDSLTGDAPQTSPAWGTGDVAAGYVAPLTSLAVDVGRLTPDNYAPREADPALAAATTFARRLGEAGVPVAGPPVRGRAPAGAARLGQVVSAPLRQVVADMLAQSDNTVADSVAVRVAAAAGVAPPPGGSIFAAGGAAVLAELRAMGVDVSGCVMDGGSGLGAGTLATSAVMAGVLALASAPRPPAGLRDLLAAMPVAGLDGTLSGRFRTPAPPGAPRVPGGAPPEPAAGLVRAKTGTLYGVTSLAGTVVDADGRALVFAVMADRVSDDGLARTEVDAVVSAVTACGCR